MKKSNTEITIGFAAESAEHTLLKANDLTKASLFWVVFLIVMGTILGISSSHASKISLAGSPIEGTIIEYTASEKISPKLWGFDPYDSKYKDPDCDFKVVSHTYNSTTGYGTIVLNKPIKVIAVGAFARCEALTSITIPSSVSTIKEGAFTCSGLEHIDIPNTVTNIGRGALMRCRQLKEVRLPSNLTIIPKQLLYHCESLQHITIPESVTEIGYMALFGCKSLKHVHIPNSVNNIGDNAFVWCDNVEAFTGKYATADGCALIKDGHLLAFANGRVLDSYTIPNEVTKICDCTIRNNYISSITLGKNITHIGHQGISCNNLKTVYCNATTPPTTTEGSYHRHHLEPDGDEYFESAPELHMCLAIYYTYSWRGLGDKGRTGHPYYDEEFTIYIPQGTIEQYKSAEGWCKYSDNFIEMSGN